MRTLCFRLYVDFLLFIVSYTLIHMLHMISLLETGIAYVTERRCATLLVAAVNSYVRNKVTQVAELICECRRARCSSACSSLIHPQPVGFLKSVQMYALSGRF